MRKERMIVVTIIIVLTLILGNFVVTIANSKNDDIFGKDVFKLIGGNYKSKNLKLDQSVSRLVGNEDISENFEDRPINSFGFMNNKVRLEVILTNENKLDALREFDDNIEIESSYMNLVQALIPFNIIEQLSEEEYVIIIKKPVKYYPSVTSEGVGVIGADLVHAEGCYGDGVKVAIIDGGFTGYSSNPELPSDRIKEVISFRGDGLIEISEHGTACAKIVLDVAPNADLYLYVIETTVEFCNAVNYAVSQGVDIISLSGGFFLQNDLDGTGIVCDAVNYARSSDVLVTVSAGNYAESHYCGWYVDNNGNYFHDFDTANDLLSLDLIPAGYPIDLCLSWNDWPGSDQDYDLWLIRYNDGNGELVAVSENWQTGSQPPIEYIGVYAPVTDYYFVMILEFSATTSVRFQFFSYYCDFYDNIRPETSISCPADAVGATTVGATYWQDDSLEPFSSRGPTNDGRIKPDVTAPDGVSTYAYPYPFYGTSASAPHTAGAAALLKSADPTLTANILQSKLESTALDLGPGGKDNSYGSGRIDVWAAFNTIDQPPNADFTYSPPNPTTLDVIQFTDTSTDDGTIVEWYWDFGDGATSSEQHPAHTYSNAGNYTVTLAITDDDGDVDSKEKIITVTEGAVWSVNLNFSEDSGKRDYVVFGEALGANDGEPPDSYDMPKPPAPQPPYLRAWFDDDLPVPYDYLWKDYRSYPDTEKTWDLYAKWESYSSTPTTITISWGIIEFANCEYSNITLMRYDPFDMEWDFATDMLTENIYVYVPRYFGGNWLIDHFQIRSLEKTENIPPIADFTYSPTNPTTLATIQFTDTSIDSDGSIASWLWDFGDGNTSNEQNPTHQYADDGVYPVNLTIADDDNATDDYEQNISVSNNPPTAIIDSISPNPAVIGETVFFNGHGVDTDGTVVALQWNSSIDGNLSNQSSFNTSSLSLGTHTISLTVKDDDGEWSPNATQPLIINNPPVANFTYEPLHPTTQDMIYFNSTSYDLDGTIMNLTWSFGGGNTSTEQNPSHQYGDDGTFIVTLNVTDNDGATNETSQQISILNVGPTSDFNYAPSIPRVNETVQFTDTSTDPDGTIISWLWDFGDGTNSTEQNPQHDFTYYETFIISLTVTDDDGDANVISKQLITKVVYAEEVFAGDNEIDLTNESDITIGINVTSSTNITLVKYSGNPTQEDIPNNITSINNYVNITVENEIIVVWPIEIKIFYSQDDLNDSNIDENQLLGIYFWDDTIGEWSLYDDAGVNTTYNQSGYEGYCWANVWHLTLLAPGGDAEPPLKVTGLTVSDAKDGKLDISWNQATDNVAVDYYNVYRDGSATPITTIDHPTTTYQDTGLTNGQAYSYEVSAIDTSGNEGEKSDSNSGTPTATDNGGGPPGGGGSPPGGGGDPPSPPTNQNPIANASAGEPYTGYIGEEITFNGSLSYDPDDGDITSWYWEFGDGTNGTGEVTIHTYSNPGVYNVTLTVTDDENAIGSTETTAIISQANRPPITPIVNGTKTGNKNIEYTYTAVSTDPDNNTIRYIFDWGDGTVDESDFLPNGTAFEVTHSWTSAGKYIVTITADDNQTSTSTEMIVMIDAIEAGDIGYVTDDDGDGTYDTFHSPVLETDLGQENGKYLIDIDGDGEWDYFFDLSEGISVYTKADGQGKTPSFEIIIVLSAVLLVLLFKIFWKRKER